MDTTCLLVMDVQSGIIDQLEDNKAYLDSIERAVKHAYSQGMTVIYVVVGFRPGMPEVSPSNKSFSLFKGEDRPGLINPQPAVKTTADDIIVTKRRVSAFSGSDLELILRSKKIDHLILCGISTSGVVLSTLREAADKDYHLTVISDLCRDSHKDVHQILVDKVFPRQADVISLNDWLKS